MKDKNQELWSLLNKRVLKVGIKPSSDFTDRCVAIDGCICYNWKAEA